MKIALTLLTAPVAKARPRVCNINGHARSFTPTKTKVAEWEIKQEIRRLHGGVTKIAFAPKVPLALTAAFYCLKPPSKPKKVQYPACKPDLDNYLKTLCDALNGCLVADDSQIVSVTVSKQYGSPARIELVLEEVADLVKPKLVEMLEVHQPPPPPPDRLKPDWVIKSFPPGPPPQVPV